MASIYKGYMGKILDIDLGSGKISEYPLKDRDRKRFLGGRFLSTKILWDELPKGADALGRENILIVMTSPLTGTGAPSSSRYDISAKSPLTGIIGHSNSGGNFGIRLKRAGWDGIIIRGASETPVYIEILKNDVKIKDAAHLWGKDTWQTQEMLGRGGKMVIGPAGENLARYATVVSQERSHGRTGMGAVMGSKNLKAIVAYGKKRPELAEEEKFKSLIKGWAKMLRSHPATGEIMPRYGTAAFVKALSAGNALPTLNFTAGSCEYADDISGEKLAEKFLIKNYGCESCPIKCGRKVMVDGREVKGPEYEILSMLGSNIGIHDLGAIIKWNYRLDLLGLDTISTGNVLGFAAELNKNGLLNNGISFGDEKCIDEAIEEIALMKGRGAELGMGVKYLSDKYGGEDYAAHAKGLELAAYEPRACVGHGLGYATASRGGCHLDGGYVVYFEVNGPLVLDPLHYRSKAAWTILDQNLLGAIGAGGNCLFTSWTALPPLVFQLPKNKKLSELTKKLLTAVWPFVDLSMLIPTRLMKFHVPMLPHPKAVKLATGMSMDFGKFMDVGARGYALEKMFNIREGVGPDELPKKFLQEPLIPGKNEYRVRLGPMLEKYYKLRGYDRKGVPLRKTLEKLDLMDVF